MGRFETHDFGTVIRPGLGRAIHPQQAPFPVIMAAGVARRILMSDHRDMVLAYRKSRRTISSKVVRLRPATCQRPVMPGLASNTRPLCQGLYCCSSYGSGGRGPTRDISPISTFQSWGNSSRLVRLRIRPIRVILGSLVSLNTAGFPCDCAWSLAVMNQLT